MQTRLTLGFFGALWGLAALSCRPDTAVPDDPDGGNDPLPVLNADALPLPGTFCALPGSVVSTPSGPMRVAGATTHNLGWLHLPQGFCAHYFGTVPKARQLKFAPDGALFVPSPSTPTTGGAASGRSAIFALRDDDQDGVADTTERTNVAFLTGLPSVQGLMFLGGYLYYQDGPTIRRVPYHSGDRTPSGSSEVVTEMGSWPQDSLHWPKVFDVAHDGTMYITNGSSQLEGCLSTRPIFGAIFKLNADGTTSLVAKGFRNPIALRCETTHDTCLAIELALDYSANEGGREKVLAVRPGDDWGYPCCATQNVPYAGVAYGDTRQAPDCSAVAAESASFVIGHTPFGLDIEPGVWPPATIDGHPGATWNGRVFITLHGDYGTWGGARLVAIALDPSTGLPLPASELGAPGDNLVDFATGWDDGSQSHGRPAPIVFAPDGRMFVGDDQLGVVVWIAPTGLSRP